MHFMMQSPRKALKYGSLTKSVGIFYQNGYIYFGGRQTNYIKSKFSKGKSRTVSEYIDVIARLDGETFKWSLLGKLNTRRSDHRIIQIQKYFCYRWRWKVYDRAVYFKSVIKRSFETQATNELIANLSKTCLT